MSAPDSPTLKPQSTYTEQEEEQNLSKNFALSGRVMLVSIITIFLLLLFLLLLHLYARWYLRRRNHTHRRNRPTRIVYYLRNNPPLSSPTAGLHASVLNSLPSFVYSSQTNSKTAECAVCLSEFEEGETGRVLPNCKHSFHTECIDMWFFSHSTCPLCRSPVEPLQTETSQMTITTLNKPGSSESASPSSPVQPDRRKRVDVTIDVPNRSESVAENEFWSPGSRLASLKRIINMSRISPVVSPSSSSVPVATGSDIESAIGESVQDRP